MGVFFKIYITVLSILLISACGKEANDKALGLAKLEVSPAGQGLLVGDSFQYIAKFIDARGVEQTDLEVEWFSSNMNVATISAQGKVVGVSEGRSQISARITTDGSGVTESNIVELTVVNDPLVPAKVVINNTDNNVMIGSAVLLSADVFNVDGVILDAETIFWASDDEAIATVDEFGLVNVLSAGTVNITASVGNVFSPVLTLTVRVENNRRVASFQSVGGYNISGEATLQVTAEGKLEVVFATGFSVEDGPGLEVFLSNTQSPTVNSVNLGPLQSTSGLQTYAVPPTVLIDDYAWIIIHCVPFDVVFGRGKFEDLEG